MATAAAATVLIGAAPSAASGAGGSVLGGKTVSGQAISCATQADGVRVCHGDDGGVGGPDLRLESFDSTPLEVYLILPPTPHTRTDGSYPLVVQSHGWGGRAAGLDSGNAYAGPGAHEWAARGYAVLQLTARGFGDSCGQAARAAESPGHYAATCSKGYIRLDDERYEAHDVQHAIGLLVDAGLVNPNEIGVTGPSYGGGVSLELATLKDRVMNPDGTLSPWRSPAGRRLRIAAAAPAIPWSDLVYSLEPNGHTLDYRLTGVADDLNPIGVEKQSFNRGLFALGQASGYYSAPRTDPQADLATWYATLNAGEPSGSEATFIAGQVARYHSPYYLLDGAYRTELESPAPLLIANGFTDDLFGVDEALRYYSLERALYPSDPLELLDGDFGHMRAQNKPGDVSLLSGRIEQFFDHYLKRSARAPRVGVTTTIESCAVSTGSGGPLWASTWAGLHPGEVEFSSARPQTVVSGAGSRTISNAIDPVFGSGACARVSATDQGGGVATYRLPAGLGFTLLGSPTVIARLSISGRFPELAARLWDVNPATNTETLVARALYRPSGSGLQVFQLHPGAWHFAAGHIPKLELLAQDAPYGRTSNGQFSIRVSSLQLRLPVHDLPGSSSMIAAPQPPVITGCAGLPHSRVARASVLALPALVALSGTAADTACPGSGTTISSRQRVAHVYVAIFRSVGHDRCRFVQRNGSLGPRALCTQPVELPARGTRRWRLRARVHLSPGRYVIFSDAVDALGQHQLPSRAATAAARIR